MKYAENGRFKTINFSYNTETYLLLNNNEILKNLILYTTDTADELYNINECVANVGEDYGEKGILLNDFSSQ